MSVLTPAHHKCMEKMLRLSDNKVCFDCGAPHPRWANTSFGVFVCMSCAGIHRSFGTHISKIQSVSLDSWTDDDIRKMECIGNKEGRILYEYRMPHSYSVYNPQSSMGKKVLADKYVMKKYFHPQLEELVSNLMNKNTESEEVEGAFGRKEKERFLSPLPSSAPIESLWLPGEEAPSNPLQKSNPVEALFSSPSQPGSIVPASNPGRLVSSQAVSSVVYPSSNCFAESSNNSSSPSNQDTSRNAQEEIISLFCSPSSNASSQRSNYAW